MSLGQAVVETFRVTTGEQRAGEAPPLPTNFRGYS
jgi:hypothetical protein